MFISTKGRYVLRIMVDLAENCQGGYIAMKDVAERQGMAMKYLEKILPILVKNEMIEGVHGKGGGYRLTRKPEDYRIGEILRLTEGDLAPAACLDCNSEEDCGRLNTCRTMPLWTELKEVVTEFLDSKTLSDLMNKTE